MSGPRLPVASKATIVAFDDLVVDSMHARAFAVADAVSAECGPCSPDIARRVVPGRTLDEAVDAALRALWPSASDTPAGCDATARDLAVLRARRSYTTAVVRGLPIRDGVASWLRDRAMQGRVVLRADSVRADADRLLAFSGIEDLVTFIRCGDDLPRTPPFSSLERSWHAIAARLDGLGVFSESCAALESDPRCAEMAHAFVRDVAIVTKLP